MRGTLRRTLRMCHRSRFITAELRRPRVRLQQPRRAVWIIAAQFVVLNGAEITSPNDARAIYIGCVIHPFLLKDVLRPVMDEDQLFAGNFCQRPLDGSPPGGIAVIEAVPGLILPQVHRKRLPVEQMKPVPESKMCGAKEQDQLSGLLPSRYAPDSQPVQPFEAGNAHKHEQAGSCGDVMRKEEWVEIGAQCEYKKR